MRSVRVGVDEAVGDDLLAGFPPEAKIVRVPAHPTVPIEVDFWILPYFRRDAEDVFRMLRGVKVMQSVMAGVDWILPWLPKDVVLCDGRGIHDVSTSEWVLAAMLTSLKRMPLYRDRQRQGEWSRRPDRHSAEPGLHPAMTDDLAGKTVLLVGYGSIGRAIEERLAPFGVCVLRIARTAKLAPEVHSVGVLRELLPRADIVVLIVPMTPETNSLMGALELDLMKRGALLINAARGPVVSTTALMRALVELRICAALDVTDPEPLPAEHPLWQAPNCMITPHVAGSTPLFAERAFRFATAQVRRFVAGEALENVVGEEGY